MTLKDNKPIPSLEENVLFKLRSPHENPFSSFFCCKDALTSSMSEFTQLCNDVDCTWKYISQQLGKGLLLQWLNAKKC